jgi:hypothetical protein
MEIKMRGWGRNMGTKMMVSHDLAEIELIVIPAATFIGTRRECSLAMAK